MIFISLLRGPKFRQNYNKEKLKESIIDENETNNQIFNNKENNVNIPEEKIKNEEQVSNVNENKKENNILTNN